MTSLPPPNLNHIDPQGLLNYFENSWQLNEPLFTAMQDPKAFYQPTDPLRHPPIFYLGHTAAFYINKLTLAGLLKKGFNDYFEKLFAEGIDPKLAEHAKQQG